MIADRRYTDAYMVNWHSNVFPGILGRTCDRPCEPACRRGRVEKEPVAICRLKRVAADNKGDIRPYLPAIPREKNGKRIALIGAGPASLTVARDLLPLGYDVRDVRRRRQGRRHDAHPDPALPPARNRHRRRGRADPRHGRRDPLRRAGAQPEGAARRGLGRGLCRLRRAARARSRHPRPRRKRRPTSISASTGCRASRSAMSTRSAAASSCSAAATRRWIAAAPRAGSAARRSPSSCAAALRR